MNKQIIALIFIFIFLPIISMAAYATFRHNAIVIGDNKDIDLYGNKIGNGSLNAYSDLYDKNNSLNIKQYNGSLPYLTLCGNSLYGNITNPVCGAFGVYYTATDQVQYYYANSAFMEINSTNKVFRVIVDQSSLDNSYIDVISTDGNKEFGLQLGSTNTYIRTNTKYLRTNGLDTGSGSALCLNASNYVFYNSGLSTCLASTEKVKTDITNVTKDMNVSFMTLKPITYISTLDNTTNYGFSAEQIKNIYPELIGHDSYGNITGVKYENMVAILTKVIQEQQITINKICTRNVSLCK